MTEGWIYLGGWMSWRYYFNPQTLQVWAKFEDIWSLVRSISDPDCLSSKPLWQAWRRALRYHWTHG